MRRSSILLENGKKGNNKEIKRIYKLKLKDLQNKLEEKKYTVVFREYDGFKWLQCFSKIENIEDKIIAFGIKLEENDFILWDASKQFSDEIKFKSEEIIIKHIEDEFS